MKFAKLSVQDVHKIQALTKKGYKVDSQDFNTVTLKLGRTEREERELKRKLAKRQASIL